MFLPAHGSSRALGRLLLLSRNPFSHVAWAIAMQIRASLHPPGRHRASFVIKSTPIEEFLGIKYEHVQTNSHLRKQMLKHTHKVGRHERSVECLELDYWAEPRWNVWCCYLQRWSEDMETEPERCGEMWLLSLCMIQHFRMSFGFGLVNRRLFK